MNSECLPKELLDPSLRRGKWTVEEERYTERIIADFENGTLDVPEGTTLRTYLSKVLHCDPMRITKKYTGNSSIGKRTFTPLPRTTMENVHLLDASQHDLRDLRRNWLSRLLLAEQWNNRKATMLKSSPSSGNLSSHDMVHSNSSSDLSALSSMPIDESLARDSLSSFARSNNQVDAGVKWLCHANYSLTKMASSSNLSVLSSSNSDEDLRNSRPRQSQNPTVEVASVATSLSELERLLAEGEVTIPMLVNQVLCAQYDNPMNASSATLQSMDTLQQLLQSLLQQRKQLSASASSQSTQHHVVSSNTLQDSLSSNSADSLQSSTTENKSQCCSTDSRKRKITADNGMDGAKIARTSTSSMLPMTPSYMRPLSFLSSDADDVKEETLIDDPFYERRNLSMEERLRAVTARQHILLPHSSSLSVPSLVPNKNSVSLLTNVKTTAAVQDALSEHVNSTLPAAEEPSQSSIVSAAEALLGLINC